jgi:hypothetical protein
LEHDELTFETPLFAEIHQLYVDGLLNDELYLASFLKRNPNQKVVQLICDIEANELEISDNWLIKHRIDTQRDKDKLPTVVPKAIYAFKLHKLNQQIGALQKQLSNPELTDEELTDLLGEKIVLEHIKLKFTSVLGRS